MVNLPYQIPYLLQRVHKSSAVKGSSCFRLSVESCRMQFGSLSLPISCETKTSYDLRHLRKCSFSRAWHQLHIHVVDSDWLLLLFASAVIG